MTKLEMVERLRERADVTFEEAAAALDEAGGDLLDALILLERQGKTMPPPKGGEYSDRADNAEPTSNGSAQSTVDASDVFRKLGNGIMELFRRGSSNYIDAIRRDKTELSCPIIVFIILLIAAFWAILPIMIIGLFFGWKYRLRGADLGREDINSVIEKAETAAEDLKATVKQAAENHERQVREKHATQEEQSEK